MNNFKEFKKWLKKDNNKIKQDLLKKYQKQ